MKNESPSLEMVDISQAVLDVSNPRVSKYLEIYPGEKSEEQIALALGAGSSQTDVTGPTFNNLKQSILTTKGSYIL